MRVKKPTSKRVPTRLREGIKKKASAKHRKDRKLAKKDVTWKSRHRKDPGVPASFPYKEKIVIDLEERKRAEKERKEQLKEQRLQEKKDSVQENPEYVTNEDMMSEDEGDGNEDSMAALVESAQRAAKEYNGEDEEEDMADSDEDEEYEISDEEKSEAELRCLDRSRKAYNKIFNAVVEASDVVLYILDARDPESTRSRSVEETVLQNPGKRLILILNKVDLIPPHVLKQWLNFLNSSFPTIPVKAFNGATTSTSYNKHLTYSSTASSLLQALKLYANKTNLKRYLMVGVIGYPNTGKSSIINSLANRHGNHSKACPVGNQAGVTTSIREIKVDNKLKILDSPGIVFPDEIMNTSKLNSTTQESKLALLSAIPPKMVSDPISAANLLLKKFSKDHEMINNLKSYYELPPLPSSDFDQFSKSFLIHIARKKGRLGKGGIPNLDSAAMAVLNDWKDGRLLGWTLPKASKAADNEEQKESSGVNTMPKNESKPTEQANIVSEWAKEFDLDSLLNDSLGV